MIENRRAPRFSLENRVDVYFGAKGIWETVGVNLSTTGILFRSREPLGLYAQAVLRIHLDAQPPLFLDVEAAALRSDAKDGWFYTAMEFLEVNDQEKSILEAWTGTKKPA